MASSDKGTCRERTARSRQRSNDGPTDRPHDLGGFQDGFEHGDDDELNGRLFNLSSMEGRQEYRPVPRLSRHGLPELEPDVS